MRLVELALLYALVGGGCSAVVLVRRGFVRYALVDAALMLVAWPLYGPFLLMRLPGPAGQGTADPTRAFLHALQQARGTPLATLLPDEAAGRALADRLRVAGERIAEIDRLLAQPEFSEAQALARHGELSERGDARAAATAMRRVENIRRLRALQGRFVSELDQVGELLAQLRIQAEVVRLAGTAEPGVRDLVRELMSRVEGLDAVLELETL